MQDKMEIRNILVGCMIIIFVIFCSYFFIFGLFSEVEYKESEQIVVNGGSVNVSNSFLYGDYSMQGKIKYEPIKVQER